MDLTLNGTFTIRSTNGNYKRKPVVSTITLAIHSIGEQPIVRLNGLAIQVDSIERLSQAYLAENALYVAIIFSGKPVTIEISRYWL